MIINSCILFFSLLNGINPAVTEAVIRIESGGKVNAVNNGLDFGLMQVRARYVPETKHQLLNPCTNIMVGTRLLKEAKKRCKHQLDRTWLVCYNAGIRGGSRLKFPKRFGYYKKFIVAMRR